MAHFCRKCGKQLDRNVKFCVYCGEKTMADLPVENVCQECGSVLRPNVKFCTACGKPTVPKSSFSDQHQKNSLAPVDKNGAEKGVGKMAPNTIPGNPELRQSEIWSAAFPGETVLQSGMNLFGSGSQIQSVLEPLKILENGIKSLSSGLKAVVRNPLKILPGLILSILWLALILLPGLGVKIPFDGVLNWLTFARGGLSGGLVGLIGGIIGKGLFAGMITAMVMAVFARKNPLANGLRGLSQFASAFRPREFSSSSYLFLGAGFALILNNFFTGDNSLQNSMLGILLAMSTIRLLGSNGGVVKSFVTALIQKFKPRKQSFNRPLILNRFMSGLAMGFALGVGLTVIKLPWIGYAAGGAFIMVGIILWVLSVTIGEVKAV